MNNEVIPNIVWAIKIIKKGEANKDAIRYIYIYIYIYNTLGISCSSF